MTDADLAMFGTNVEESKALYPSHYSKGLEGSRTQLAVSLQFVLALVQCKLCRLFQ